VIDKKAEDEAAAAAKISAWENRRKIPKVTMDGAIVGLEPKIQGCLLLQSLAQCSEANEVVLQSYVPPRLTREKGSRLMNSLIDQPTETLITYSTNPIASRLLDIVLTHPSIPTKYRRRLISTLTPHLEDLLADKIGSRVAERVWESADGYTKEKIAKILVKSSESIRRSQYGRYLWPKLKLDIMMRRPDQWRAEAIGVKHHFAHQKEAVNPTTTAPVEEQEEASEEQEDKKRKTDDIDELFEGVIEKKKQKSKKDRA
jgi:nucleolar protein 9